MRFSGFVFAASFAATCCWAQSWSLGGAGGFGVYKYATITNAAGSATAGFGPRFAAGVVLCENVSEHFGGEFRYTFRDGDSELRSAGTKVTMDAAAHTFEYDLLYYLKPRHSRIRPFVAAGPGVKYYTGTGQEAVRQPLSNFAVLLHANEMKPMASFGGGLKATLSDHWLLRVDFRDFATPFPQKLITPAKGAAVHGWLHDFVPMVGIDWRFP